MKFNLSKYFKSNKPLRPLIVAEISANHCGKKSLFIKTIKSAAKNGADLIKIQTYEPGDIIKNLTIEKFGNFIQLLKPLMRGIKKLLIFPKN